MVGVGLLQGFLYCMVLNFFAKNSCVMIRGSRFFFPLVERVKEQLKLCLETKNGVVQTGELTVVLDGLVIEQENITNGSSSPASKLTLGY